MWWAPIAAAGVSAAGGLLSSMFGGRTQQTGMPIDEQMYYQNVYANEQFEKNAALQREFAQMGTRWRVEDAKAAGLHPLFALGGQLPAGQPIHVGGSNLVSQETIRKGGDVPFAQMGQDISRALLAALDADAGRLRDAQIRSAEARAGIDEVQLVALRNEAARKAQEDYFATPIENMVPNAQGVRVKALPQQAVIEGRPIPDYPSNYGQKFSPHIDTESLNTPTKFWSQYQFGPGASEKIILPRGNDVADIFDDKPLFFWSMVIAANERQFGPQWKNQMRQILPPDSSFRQALDAAAPYSNPGRQLYEGIRERVLKFGEQYRR